MFVSQEVITKKYEMKPGTFVIVSFREPTRRNRNIAYSTASRLHKEQTGKTGAFYHDFEEAIFPLLVEKIHYEEANGTPVNGLPTTAPIFYALLGVSDDALSTVDKLFEDMRIDVAWDSLIVKESKEAAEGKG